MVSVLIFVLLIQLVQINAAILSTCCVGLDLQTLVHTPNFPSLPQSLSLHLSPPPFFFVLSFYFFNLYVPLLIAVLCCWAQQGTSLVIGKCNYVTL